MVSKRVLEKGVEKRSEKGHASRCEYFSCSPLKEHPRMGDRETLTSLEHSTGAQGHGGGYTQRERERQTDRE